MSKPIFLKKPLTSEEIKERYNEVLEEWKIVNEWVKEEKEKLERDNFKTPQSKSATQRNIIKAKRRVDSVRGTKKYWENRIEGMSHFRASIELNEYWASLKERDTKKRKARENVEMPNLLKKKRKNSSSN
jgi:hypothetical protein